MWTCILVQFCAGSADAADSNYTFLLAHIMCYCVVPMQRGLKKELVFEEHLWLKDWNIDLAD